MITVGTPTVGAATSISGSMLHLTHTVDAGTNMLVYGITAQMDGSPTGFDAATWNGAPMILAKQTSFSNRCVALFILKDPLEGTFDAAAHWTGVVGVSANHLFAVNLSGVVKARPGDTEISSLDDPSVLFTVQGAAGVIFDVFAAGSDATPGGSQTSIFTNVNKALYHGGASFRAHTGNLTNTYTGSTSAVYAGCEVVEGKDYVPRMSLL